MMARGFDTLNVGQERLIRRVSDLQQRQLELARYVYDRDAEASPPRADTFPPHLLQPYRSPSPERDDDEWPSWSD